MFQIQAFYFMSIEKYKALDGENFWMEKRFNAIQDPIKIFYYQEISTKINNRIIELFKVVF